MLHISCRKGNIQTTKFIFYALSPLMADTKAEILTKPRVQHGSFSAAKEGRSGGGLQFQSCWVSYVVEATLIGRLGWHQRRLAECSGQGDNDIFSS
jgi:hypothetical protein